MTYNILDGGEGRENDILSVVQAANSDIVIFQEIYSEEFLKRIAHELHMGYFFFGNGSRKRRVGFISRYPIRSPQSNHSFPIWRNFVEAEIEYRQNRTFRLIGIHPIANLSVIFEIWRWLEMGVIIKHYQKYNDQACLIAGDFNAIAPRDMILVELMPSWLKLILCIQGKRAYHFSISRLLAAGFIDCYRMLHTDDGFTLPPPKPNTRLDYCFVNDKMKASLKNCWVVYEPSIVEKASDHYPVVAAFEFLDTATPS